MSLFSQPAQAQVNQRLTVRESVQRGLEHSFLLQATSAETEAAEAAYRSVRTGRLPSIQAQASYMRLSNNIPEVDIAVPGSDTSYTFLPVELNQFHTEASIKQLLFAGGRLNNQIEAANHRADAAGLMEKKQRVEVAFNIRKAYWHLYQAQASVEVIESVLAQIEEHLEIVRARVEEGAALRTDLLSAKARRAEIRLDQVKVRSKVHIARLELNRLIGLPASMQVELVAPEQPNEIPFKMDVLMHQALQQRPGLHAQMEKVRAREAEIDAIQSGWLPKIHLVGRYIYARPNQYFFMERDQFRGTWEAGLTLQWNLWSGGQRVTETSQARARLQSAEARLAHKKEQVSIKIAQRYLELQKTVKAIDVSAISVDAAKEALQTAREQYEEGIVLSTQVLDAEQAYRKAQISHVKAIAEYQIAHASVLDALGQIWGARDEG